MVRLISILVGLGFVGVATWSLLWGVVAYLGETHEETIEHRFHLAPKEASFAHQGPFGRYDRQQLQRGFQVYKEVCSACHSLNYIAFRNLEQLGYSEAEVKAIATQWPTEVPSINDQTGEPATRKAIPADRIPSPYPNEVAARAANNNAAPPDLSLITKARHEGPSYVYSLLTGYADATTYKNEKGEPVPEASRPGPNLHFNPYFPNLNLAMPPPIAADGQVTYADGTVATKDQMAMDVAAFLTWTAEPFLENRHRAGIAIMFFLLIATVLAYMAYKNVWASVKKRPVHATGMSDEERMRRQGQSLH
ncbi:MAG TPA: cytochrome c1 [Allosphingosinicella sp.]|jgi:ubiquinol-cytochrome c reductase cytochrome c1 subunit